MFLLTSNNHLLYKCSHKVYFKSVGPGIVHFIHFTNTGCYEVVAFLSHLQKFAIVEGHTQVLSVRSV